MPNNEETKPEAAETPAVEATAETPAVEAEVVGAANPSEEEPKRAEWQFKTEFGINTRMREIVHKAIEFSELELANLRRKLDRMTYGG